ncbi:hypothetical protein BDV3_007264 [Batrachochytrium dendrobatidis]|nr:hypothetical protein O5D80_006124 [Batrachochytrium dendrobatidis]
MDKIDQHQQTSQHEQEDITKKTTPPMSTFEDPSGHPLPKKSINPLLGKFQKPNGSNTFKSPTDNIMSPATQKVEAKRHRLLSSIKPKSLSGRFAEAAEPVNGKEI